MRQLTLRDFGIDVDMDLNDIYVQKINRSTKWLVGLGQQTPETYEIIMLLEIFKEVLENDL